MASVVPLLVSFAIGAAITTLDAPTACGTGYDICAPSGASYIIQDWTHLYENLVSSVNSVPHFRRETDSTISVSQEDTVISLCCVDGMQCLALMSSNVPFCWDRFTTNVYLPGGWYGSIATGNFTSPSGSILNLISGDYINGSGNIYSTDMNARPNTVTMHLPSPWTSKGIGSAIPASILGTSATYTAIIPPTMTVTVTSSGINSVTAERNTAPTITALNSITTGIPLATQTSGVMTPTVSAKQTGYANSRRIGGIGVVITIGFMVLIISL